MSANRRPFPYAWVSWITGLLSGEDHCQWAAWYKAHWQGYAKVNEMTAEDRSRHNQRHAAMVAARRRELTSEAPLPSAVTVESQNKFIYKGHVADVGGKPDIIALWPDRALVSDQKSGRPRDAHAWQVRLYMLLSPVLRHRIVVAGHDVVGEVDYGPEQRERLTLTPEDAAAIADQMRVTAGDEEPPKTPSWDECRFCAIADCDERVTAPGGQVEEVDDQPVF